MSSSPKRIPRAILATGVAALLTGVTALIPTPAQARSAAATNLSNYLIRISGNHVVSGIHTSPDQPGYWFDQVHKLTGVYPGMWGSDFHFEATKITERQNMIDFAKTEWSSGSLVELSYHACPPTMPEPCTWSDVTSPLTDVQWSQLVTNGTVLNNAWKSRLDVIAAYLKQLRDAGIPVLWRPLHEMNAPWAWWGGRPGSLGSRKLFQITFNYLTNVKGLDNLIWVWSVKDVNGGAGTLADYWPGDQYVDVAGLDVWVNHQPTSEYYQAMLGIAGTNPIAMTETGTTPTPQTMQAQPRWCWFLEWAGYLVDPAWNTTAGVQATFGDPRVYNQGEITL